MTVSPLPQSPIQYDHKNENQTRDIINRALQAAILKGDDVVIGYPPGAPNRLILADSVTGTRYKLTIVSGTLTVTAI